MVGRWYEHKRDMIVTYDVNAAVDLRKASLANMLETLELADDLVGGA